MENVEIVSDLNDLLQTTHDAEDGFAACSEHVSGVELRGILDHAAKMSEDRANVLEEMICSLGGEPSGSGSVAGELYRAWAGFKSSLVGADDRSVLAECERGEDVAKSVYEKALAKALPKYIKKVIEQQFAGVREDHDKIKVLRDAAASRA